ncbi:unnamed protein product [Prunus armeniaca]|uniref:Uncharacterized protein n=1 Tax=Prunus armeniaca TaxID=36596 RepID=A0A6J5VH71_PRUAR|nr:unnamed protein product [Prunus armeniaca]
MGMGKERAEIPILAKNVVLLLRNLHISSNTCKVIPLNCLKETSGSLYSLILLSIRFNIFNYHPLDIVKHWIPHKELQNSRRFDLNGPVLGGRPPEKLCQESLNHELFS